MKKLILFISLMMAGTVSAQEVGIRWGDVLGNDFAIDAVFSLAEFSRVHADVSFGNGVGVEAIWDFLYRPLGESFNWYVGVGPSVLIDDPFWLGFSGEVGLEYHFDGAPIAIGADWRPTFWVIEDTDFHAGGFGINARYVFK
ncbi:MAG TPA: outer membrane insertion C- signal [Candidatus Kapabacteria bacterium]